MIGSDSRIQRDSEDQRDFRILANEASESLQRSWSLFCKSPPCATPVICRKGATNEEIGNEIKWPSLKTQTDCKDFSYGLDLNFCPRKQKECCEAKNWECRKSAEAVHVQLNFQSVVLKVLTT